MNLQAIEVIVRRLFSDADFRARAIAEPAAALAEYRLAAEERAALTKLCAQLAAGPQGAQASIVTPWYYWW